MQPTQFHNVHTPDFRVVQGWIYVYRFCKRSIILVICTSRKTVGKMRCRKNEMSEKCDKKCLIFPTEIVSEIWDVGKMRPPRVISAAYTSPPLSCAPAFLKNLGLYPRFFCGIICIYDTLQYRVGGGDDAPFPKKMLDYLYILMPPPPLQGRTKKKSKGGEVLFVSAPFCSVIFTPPQYIIRFNPPPLLFQSHRGGVISASYTYPPLSCAPALLKNLGIYPRFFWGIIGFIWYFEI